jgi:predicted MFS family arabinose efflux permease
VAGPRRTASGRLQLPPRVELAGHAMFVLRSCVGFMMFHLAFWFRTQDSGTFWFGVAVGLSALGTMAGNAVGPRLRSRVSEERMIAGALAVPAVVGLVAALLGGRPAGIALAVALNTAAAVARLGFESLVQRESTGENRGLLFARLETRFQLGWVAAATLPVLLRPPGWLGFALVGVVTAATFVSFRRGPVGGPATVRRR